MTFTTNFKGPRVTEKARRKAKRAIRDGHERDNKTIVRTRDKLLRNGCAFPMCGCRLRHRYLMLEVSHLVHKSMGGNPKEDRSTPDKMIQVCTPRHRTSCASIDNKTLQCRPLTSAGTDGPVSWWIDYDVMVSLNPDFAGAPHICGWVELAREEAPGRIQMPTPGQCSVLLALANNMEL